MLIWNTRWLGEMTTQQFLQWSVWNKSKDMARQLYLDISFPLQLLEKLASYSEHLEADREQRCTNVWMLSSGQSLTILSSYLWALLYRWLRSIVGQGCSQIFSTVTRRASGKKATNAHSKQDHRPLMKLWWKKRPSATELFRQPNTVEWHQKWL